MSTRDERSVYLSMRPLGNWLAAMATSLGDSPRLCGSRKSRNESVGQVRGEQVTHGRPTGMHRVPCVCAVSTEHTHTS